MFRFLAFSIIVVSVLSQSGPSYRGTDEKKETHRPMRRIVAETSSSPSHPYPSHPYPSHQLSPYPIYQPIPSINPLPPPIHVRHRLTHQQNTPSPHQEEEKEEEGPCCLDDAFEDPILSTILFFDKCPLEITNQTICAAVSRSLGIMDTVLSPREDVDINALIVPPHNRHSAASVHFTESYDIAVITAGLCFSIYPNVKYGQMVPFECNDAPFSDDALLSIFQFASIWTPGDFFSIIDGPSVARSIYVGGNWEGLLEIEINVDEVLGGCFPTNPLFIGGDVANSPNNDIYTYPFGDLSVTVLLGGDDLGGRIVEPLERLTKEQVNEAKFEISVKTCMLSKMIQSRKANGSAVITTRTNGNLDLLIACPGDNPFCVVELNEGIVHPIDVVMFITSEVNGAEVVKINVPGGVQVGGVSFTNIIVEEEVPFIWNFYEADVINFATQALWHGSIVAPRARKVSIESFMVTGTILMGHIDSHLVMQFGRLLHPASEVYCPPAEPSIVLCDCLCRKEEEKVKK